MSDCYCTDTRNVVCHRCEARAAADGAAAAREASQRTRDAYANGHVAGYRVGREDATREIVAALRERAQELVEPPFLDGADLFERTGTARRLELLAVEIEGGEFPPKGVE